MDNDSCCLIIKKTLYNYCKIISKLCCVIICEPDSKYIFDDNGTFLLHQEPMK